jgi:hypothetical protein
MGLFLSLTPNRPSLFIVFNPHNTQVSVALPDIPAPVSSVGNTMAAPRAWRLVLDTGLPCPADFPSENVSIPYPDTHYVLKPCSAAIMVAN